jgi:hypothetical protein
VFLRQRGVAARLGLALAALRLWLGPRRGRLWRRRGQRQQLRQLSQSQCTPPALVFRGERGELDVQAGQQLACPAPHSPRVRPSRSSPLAARQPAAVRLPSEERPCCVLSAEAAGDAARDGAVLAGWRVSSSARACCRAKRYEACRLPSNSCARRATSCSAAHGRLAAPQTRLSRPAQRHRPAPSAGSLHARAGATRGTQAARPHAAILATAKETSTRASEPPTPR